MSVIADSREFSADGVGELQIEQGVGSGLRRVLISPLTFIGRAEWADLRVEAGNVSDWHCVVARTESGLILRDLHSEAGTLVNGHPVTTHELCEGDLIAVGPVLLRVRWQPTGVPQTAAAAWERQRRELEQLREEVRKQRTQIQEDRDRFETRVARVHQDLSRDRLAMLEHQKELRAQAAELQREQAELCEGRLRLSREVEQAREELHHARMELQHDQETFQRYCLEREQLLEQRQEAVAAAERDWQVEKSQRQKELTALDQRLQDRRQNLVMLAQPATLAPRSVEHAAWPAWLEGLALELAEQRRNLIEQCDHFRQARRVWQQEREAVAAELEAIALRLQAREQQVEDRTIMLQTREVEAERRWAALDYARNQLEADRARHAAERSTWELARASTFSPTGAREASNTMPLKVDSRDRLIAELRDEVERLACALLDESPSALVRHLPRAA